MPSPKIPCVGFFSVSGVVPLVFWLFSAAVVMIIFFAALIAEPVGPSAWLLICVRPSRDKLPSRLLTIPCWLWKASDLIWLSVLAIICPCRLLISPWLLTLNPLKVLMTPWWLLIDWVLSVTSPWDTTLPCALLNAPPASNVKLPAIAWITPCRLSKSAAFKDTSCACEAMVPPTFSTLPLTCKDNPLRDRMSPRWLMSSPALTDRWSWLLICPVRLLMLPADNCCTPTLSMLPAVLSTVRSTRVVNSRSLNIRPRALCKSPAWIVNFPLV